MNTDSPSVCTLSNTDVPARTRQIRHLADGLRSRHRSPGMVQLRFAPELADRVREFVRDESDCCSFFGFAIDELDNEVQLTVYAPQEAQQLLDSLHEVFADRPWPNLHPAWRPVTRDHAQIGGRSMAHSELRCG